MTVAGFLGDSVLGAAPYSWAVRLSDRLGWETPALNGGGGTGYVAGGVNAYTERVATLLAEGPFAYVIVNGSSNDKPNDAAEVAALGAAAAEVFAAITATGAALVVIGLTIQPYWLTADPRFVTGQAAIETAALAAGGTYVNPVDEAWITGTGHVGDEQGDGTGDTLMQDDWHPSNPAGHNYLAARIAQDVFGARNVRGIALESGALLAMETLA